MRNAICGLAVALVAAPAFAGDLQDSCAVKACPAGMAGVTYATKAEPFYACPTAELAEYTNFVLGIAAMGAAMGSMPNVSPVTGEPEMEGTTKGMMGMFRERAGVKTFDQAVAQCFPGKGKKKVVVANNPKDGTVIWVSSDNPKMMFWIPKASLDPKKVK